MKKPGEMTGIDLVLLPGLGADQRLFEPQRNAGLVFHTPRMPMPRRGEGMADYAKRLAEQLNLHAPCLVGGASFGGMVACELASICGARGVLLIGSCRSATALPPVYGLIERVSRPLPDTVLFSLGRLGAELAVRQESLGRRERRLVIKMYVETPVTVFRQAAAMILGWTRPTQLECPVYHIHGDHDRVIPLRGVRPDVVVAGGGHLINLTHPRIVNEFIAECLKKCASSQ